MSVVDAGQDTQGLDGKSSSLARWRRSQPFVIYQAQERVAVFIDFENLVCGAGKGLPGQSDPIPDSALTYLCRGFHGNASIRRAYADWANTGFGKYQQALANNGVDLVQIARIGGTGKNSADIRMVVDAMEVLIIPTQTWRCFSL